MIIIFFLGILVSQKMAAERESSTLITAPEKPQSFDFTFLREMSAQDLKRFLKIVTDKSFIIRIDSKVYDHTSMSGPNLQSQNERYGLIALSPQLFDIPRFVIILPEQRYPNYLRRYWELNCVQNNGQRALELMEGTEIYVNVPPQDSFQLSYVFPISTPILLFEKIEFPKASQL